MKKKNNSGNWGCFLHILNGLFALGLFLYGIQQFSNSAEGVMSALLGAFLVWIMFAMAIGS